MHICIIFSRGGGEYLKMKIYQSSYLTKQNKVIDKKKEIRKYEIKLS